MSLTSPDIRKRFPDLHPAFSKQEAVVEANRCLYCSGAPCTAACPTHIDVPRFIKKIVSGNLTGSALTIPTPTSPEPPARAFARSMCCAKARA